MMIIKTFRAHSSVTALKMVREQMGGDAIVLKTTQTADEKKRRVVEVTACLEKPSVAQTSKIFADTNETDRDNDIFSTETLNSDNPTTSHTVTIPETENRFQDMDIQKSTTENTTSGFDNIAGILKEHDVLPTIINDLKKSTHEAINEDMLFAVERTLVARLSKQMLPTLSFNSGDSIAFVGAAGSGKSSVLGKIAAKLVFQDKQKVTLCSLDDRKLGAHDEIYAYGDILQSEVTSSPVTKNPEAVTLIDTPALIFDNNQNDRMIKRLCELKPTHVIAVVSAVSRARDLEKLSEVLIQCSPTHSVLSMADMTVCLGAVLNVTTLLDIPLMGTTDTPGGIGSIVTPDPAKIIREMLNTEMTNE